MSKSRLVKRVFVFCFFVCFFGQAKVADNQAKSLVTKAKSFAAVQLQKWTLGGVADNSGGGHTAGVDD